MISNNINCSTGPVRVTATVKQAFCKHPVSHRSVAFRKLFRETQALLSTHFNVKNACLLTGSGTMANEAMLWQIRFMQKKGLILSNGEFGERLTRQADRLSIAHHNYSLPWGVRIQAQDIIRLMKEHKPAWLLFCHCETSTGIVNPLADIVDVAAAEGVKCFVDCMSTVGTAAIDLSGVAMATCSSGKGLASFPGLAIVLSNMQLQTSDRIPVYADLSEYHLRDGIPFTISSNMVEALYTSIREKMIPEQYALVNKYSAKIRKLFCRSGVLLYNDPLSRVFTLRLPQPDTPAKLKRLGLAVSYESDYLQKRKWCQLALFGFYSEDELKQVVEILESVYIKPGVLSVS